MALKEFLNNAVGAASGAIKVAQEGFNHRAEQRAAERAIRQEAARLKAAEELAERERIAREKAEQERLAARRRNIAFAGFGVFILAIVGIGAAETRKKEAAALQQKAEQKRQSNQRQAAELEKNKADEAKRKAGSDRIDASNKVIRERRRTQRSNQNSDSCWRYINGGPVNVCD